MPWAGYEVFRCPPRLLSALCFGGKVPQRVQTLSSPRLLSMWFLLQVADVSWAFFLQNSVDEARQPQ